MNYLAHIFLSGDNRKIQIGNFIGDAVKGKDYRAFAPEICQGILLHRRIDAFSDTHPAVKEAIGLGRVTFGRYSAVVTDIFFDHFLAINFKTYSGHSLRSFAWRFYVNLLCHYRYLPSRFQRFMWHFILTDRLSCYATPAGIRHSLAIMAKYRGLPVDPVQADEFLRTNHQELQVLFQSFFPAVRAMCAEELSKPAPPNEHKTEYLPTGPPFHR